MQKKYGHLCHEMEYATVMHCKIKILMTSKSLKSFVVVRCFQDPLHHYSTWWNLVHYCPRTKQKGTNTTENPNSL